MHQRRSIDKSLGSSGEQRFVVLRSNIFACKCYPAIPLPVNPAVTFHSSDTPLSCFSVLKACILILWAPLSSFFLELVAPRLHVDAAWMFD